MFNIKELLKKKEDQPLIPTEQELNVIRVFAGGNTELMESAVRIGRKYSHLKELPEILFMREVDNVCPDLALRNQYRKEILEQK